MKFLATVTLATILSLSLALPQRETHSTIPSSILYHDKDCYDTINPSLPAISKSACRLAIEAGRTDSTHFGGTTQWRSWWPGVLMFWTDPSNKCALNIGLDAPKDKFPHDFVGFFDGNEVELVAQGLTSTCEKGGRKYLDTKGVEGVEGMGWYVEIVGVGK